MPAPQGTSPEIVAAVEGLYRRYVRIATSTSGRRLLVYPARNVRLYEPRPARCTAAFRRRVGRLLRGRSAGFERAARRALEQVIRDEWAGPKPEPTEGLFLFDYNPGGPGGGGGGVDVATVRRRGMFGSSQRGGHNGRPTTSTVSGLLPDGVASITVDYGTKPVPAPDQPVDRYSRPITRTVAVRQNVVSFTVARAAQDGLPRRMVWRAADGSVVRVVRQP